MTTDKQNLAIAYHEAGHAVAAIVLGFTIKHVTIVESEDANGSILYPLYRFQYDWTARVYRREVREFLITTLAGHIAEMRFSCVRNDDGASADDERVDSILWSIYGERSDKHRRDLEREAERVVERHWGHIRNVALALAERQTLTNDEVLKLVQA